jgi:hypothetical protein
MADRIPLRGDDLDRSRRRQILLFDREVYQGASSEESVGDGERQRAASMRNRRNFLQVESKDLC